jgi:NAD(P)-dependent dehydrogenase (short-subunit alcohol dehydrogenase family)
LSGQASLADRVAVVFGSATGIGATSARTLAERGATVVVADVDYDRAAQVARELHATGCQALALACDVSEEAQVASAVDVAVSRFGRLDIVHNNAAAMQLVPADRGVVEADVDHWDATFRVNLRGQMLGCKHAVRVMRETGGGSIVNTASASGVLGDLGLTAYGVAKAGVVQLTRAVAVQHGRDLIRCNAVIPGLIDVGRRPGTGMPPEERSRLAEHQTLPVTGLPTDVANAVAFLAGDEARFITGSVIVVDGGLTTHMPTYADAVRAAPA